MRDQYHGTAAERYDQVWRTFTTRMLAPVVEHATVGLPSGVRILDAGCGTGVLLAQVREQRPDLVMVGSDASTDMLKQAHARLGDAVHLVQWNLNDDPPAEVRSLAPYTLITCTNVIHYLRSPKHTMAAFTHLLAPGGRLILMDFTRHGWWWPFFEVVLHMVDRSHQRTLHPADILDLVAETELVVSASQTIHAGGPWRGTMVEGARSL